MRILGIPVRIEAGWLVILALVVWTYGRHVYGPMGLPHLEPWASWGLALISALFLFASLVAHELAHALAARACRIRIVEITLFLFGGLARLKEPPRTPGAELAIALAGPSMSALVAGAFLTASELWDEGTVAGAFTRQVGMANLGLALFNLLPAYPLDGGRVLRALVWRWTGDVRRADLVGSVTGSALALGLIVVGTAALVTGRPILAAWNLLLGIFVHRAARARLENLAAGSYLEGVAAREVMFSRGEGAPSPSGRPSVQADDPVLAAVELMAAGDLQEVAVFDGPSYVGLLDRQAIYVFLDRRAGGRAADDPLPGDPAETG